VEFIETSTFTRLLPAYLDDEGYRLLQAYLMETPEAGKVIPGTAGLRKLRWRDPRRSKGKRGGLRIIYYHLAEGSQIWLITLYDKDEADDLTAAEKKAYRGLINEIKAAWAAKRKAE
jgi:hypothetical protein